MKYAIIIVTIGPLTACSLRDTILREHPYFVSRGDARTGGKPRFELVR